MPLLLTILANADDDGSGGGAAIVQLGILLLIPLAMYFLMIRSQRKRMREQAALQSALDLGLAHLSLDRPAPTLSAGELQRIRLAAQLRSGLFGVAYVLDEPSAGLHPSERGAVLDICRRFIEAGNSVLLVEHDMELVAQTDWLVDVGPLAGERGGEVVYSGPTSDYTGDAPTAKALANRALSPNDDPRSATGELRLFGVSARSIDGLDVSFGMGQFTAVAGVSGSGKSSLAFDTIYA